MLTEDHTKSTFTLPIFFFRFVIMFRCQGESRKQLFNGTDDCLGCNKAVCNYVHIFETWCTNPYAALIYIPHALDQSHKELSEVNLIGSRYSSNN